MYRLLLVLTLLFPVNLVFSETIPDISDSLENMTSSNDTIADSTAIADSTSIPKQQAKSGKAKMKDKVDKESLGYKIGYQIGSWLIPGILMIIVSFLIYKRSRRK